MTGAFDRLAAGLNQVIHGINDAATTTQRCEQGIEEARQRFMSVTGGSSNRLCREVDLHCQHAIQLLGDARQLLGGAVDSIHDYADAIGAVIGGSSSALSNFEGSGGSAPRAVAPPPAAAPAPKPKPDPFARLPYTPEFPLRMAGRRLPKREGLHKRTSGRLFKDDSSTAVTPEEAPITSGEDNTLNEDLNLTREEKRSSSLLSHVEAKAAAAIRRGQAPKDSILVINNEPCLGPNSCDTLLPAILPAGTRLAIYKNLDGENTEFHKLYIGTGEKIKK